MLFNLLVCGTVYPLVDDLLITRQEIVQYAIEHEEEVKTRLREKLEAWLAKPIPVSGHQKYLSGDDKFGPLDISQNWGEFQEDEFLDAFFYQATDDYKTLHT